MHHVVEGSFRIRRKLRLAADASIDPGYADKWMATFSGLKFYPGRLKETEVDVEDIAHALSNLCRFGGHTRSFYSVSQHSVLVSQIVPPELALVGLLHDATEAYLVDLPRALKGLLPDYKRMENCLWRVIALRLGLPLEMPPEIKDADNVALVTERRDLIEHPVDTWEVERVFQPLARRIIPWTPSEAKTLFLERYEELT